MDYTAILTRAGWFSRGFWSAQKRPHAGPPATLRLTIAPPPLAEPAAKRPCAAMSADADLARAIALSMADAALDALSPSLLARAAAACGLAPPPATGAQLEPALGAVLRPPPPPSLSRPLFPAHRPSRHLGNDNC